MQFLFKKEEEKKLFFDLVGDIFENSFSFIFLF